jgi:hypothetical protein
MTLSINGRGLMGSARPPLIPHSTLVIAHGTLWLGAAARWSTSWSAFILTMGNMVESRKVLQIFDDHGQRLLDPLDAPRFGSAETSH